MDAVVAVNETAAVLPGEGEWDGAILHLPFSPSRRSGADRLDDRSGNIDLLNPTYWNASDGNQSIDLDGDDAGSISQVLPTVVGQKYDVKFRYTANPESSDPAPTWP